MARRLNQRSRASLTQIGRAGRIAFAAAGLLAITTTIACRPARHKPVATVCEKIGVLQEQADLSALYANSSGTIVVIGSTLFECPCGTPRTVKGATEDHHVKGATEDHHVKGDTEDHHVKGDTEDHHVKGDTEDHHVKGDTEDHHVKGDTEDHHVKGDTEDQHVKGATEDHHVKGATEDHHVKGAIEDHHVKGDVEPVTCTRVPECGGFAVSGANVTQVLHSNGLVNANSSCVIDR